MLTLSKSGLRDCCGDLISELRFNLQATTQKRVFWHKTYGNQFMGWGLVVFKREINTSNSISLERCLPLPSWPILTNHIPTDTSEKVCVKSWYYSIIIVGGLGLSKYQLPTKRSKDLLTKRALTNCFFKAHYSLMSWPVQVFNYWLFFQGGSFGSYRGLPKTPEAGRRWLSGVSPYNQAFWLFDQVFSPGVLLAYLTWSIPLSTAP